jgi:hypothetical protein
MKRGKKKKKTTKIWTQIVRLEISSFITMTIS